MSSVTIRPAQPSDLPALNALELASFTTDLLPPARMRHWISATNGLLLVATSGRGATAPVLGYALCMTRRNSKRARLYSIAIAKPARGQGIGARLLKHMIKQLRSRQLQGFYLEVATNNQAAISLYQRLGFVCCTELPDYYEDGTDAQRMELQL